jgi:hypothetical protein
MANQLSYEEATALALDIIRRGQNKGVPLAQLIKNIMRPADADQNVRPEAAGRSPFPQGVGSLGGVFEPVPAKVVTPASPAPVQEGVEIKAPTPPPSQQYETPYALQSRLAAQAFAAAQAPGENASIAQRGDYNLLRAKAEDAKNVADIAEAAKVRPEEERIFAGRENRAAERLAELQKERKSSKWKALAEAGFKMAQSNSPYFMQALASGMEAGVKGYDARKAKADEEESLLKDQKENVSLARIRAIDAARAMAVDAYRAGDKTALAKIQAADAAKESVLSGDTAESRKENALLAPKVTLASIAKEEAAAEAYLAAADKDRRTDPNLRNPGGGNGQWSPFPKNSSSTLAALVNEKKPYLAMLVDPLVSDLDKAAARAKIADIDKSIEQTKSLMSLNGTPPAATPAPKSGGNSRPAGVGANWTLEFDKNGNKAWVSPDRTKFKEVR